MKPTRQLFGTSKTFWPRVMIWEALRKQSLQACTCSWLSTWGKLVPKLSRNGIFGIHFFSACCLLFLTNWLPSFSNLWHEFQISFEHLHFSSRILDFLFYFHLFLFISSNSSIFIEHYLTNTIRTILIHNSLT